MSAEARLPGRGGPVRLPGHARRRPRDAAGTRLGRRAPAPRRPLPVAETAAGGERPRASARLRGTPTTRPRRRTGEVCETAAVLNLDAAALLLGATQAARAEALLDADSRPPSTARAPPSRSTGCSPRATCTRRTKPRPGFRALRGGARAAARATRRPFSREPRPSSSPCSRTASARLVVADRDVWRLLQPGGEPPRELAYQLSNAEERGPLPATPPRVPHPPVPRRRRTRPCASRGSAASGPGAAGSRPPRRGGIRVEDGGCRHDGSLPCRAGATVPGASRARGRGGGRPTARPSMSIPPCDPHGSGSVEPFHAAGTARAPSPLSSTPSLPRSPARSTPGSSTTSAEAAPFPRPSRGSGLASRTRTEPVRRLRAAARTGSPTPAGRPSGWAR